jgi:hypothetical protein
MAMITKNPADRLKSTQEGDRMLEGHCLEFCLQAQRTR